MECRLNKHGCIVLLFQWAFFYLIQNSISLIMPELHSEKRNISTLIAIIIAGESIFFLPFVLARIFRPTLLEVFEITNTELGIYFSIYGVVAMISYLFGGVLADRFSARALMATALWLTSFAGMAMAFVPSSLIMKIIYGVYGFTSIFLFWAAMIRATREWGGSHFQGRAFGWLEGGRGATAALLGTLSFLIFAWFVPESGNSSEVSSHGFHPFQIVIAVISVIVFMSGIVVWYYVPATKTALKKSFDGENIKRILFLIKNQSIWMLAIIIVCAYVGYKITDDFSLYAREILGFSEVESAGVGTAALWVRALVAILAGYMGDKFNKMQVISIGFALSFLGGLGVASGYLSHYAALLLMSLLFTAIGVYSIRALYFAVLKEAKISVLYTGTAVGIVSFVGYTPDVFMSPWMGYLLDNNPGELGHQYVFLVLSSFAFVGLITSLLFKYMEEQK